MIKPRLSVMDAKNALIMADIVIKEIYDRNHKACFIKVNNYVMLRLYRGYKLFIIINSKLSPQFIKPFKIIKRIKKLIYRL